MEAPEIAANVSGSLQAYANLAVGTLVAIVFAVGYWRKVFVSVKDDDEKGYLQNVFPAMASNTQNLVEGLVLSRQLLTDIGESLRVNKETLMMILTIMQTRERRDDLEREYQRGLRDKKEGGTNHPPPHKRTHETP